VLFAIRQELSQLGIERRIAQKDSRPIRPALATAGPNGPEKLPIDGRREDAAPQSADRFHPHAPELRLRHALARQVPVDEILMGGIAELDDDIVEMLEEAWLANQLAQELVLLLEPMRFDEGDKLRTL
jgi:hypothetical protein